MAKTLDELFSELPTQEIPPFEDWDPIDPDALWVDYDDELDDLIIYFSAEERGGMHVHIDNGYYVVVSDSDERPIGLHFEHWERNFAPLDSGLEQMWRELRRLGLAKNEATMRAFAAAKISPRATLTACCATARPSRTARTARTGCRRSALAAG